MESKTVRDEEATKQQQQGGVRGPRRWELNPRTMVADTIRAEGPNPSCSKDHSSSLSNW